MEKITGKLVYSRSDLANSTMLAVNSASRSPINAGERQPSIPLIPHYFILDSSSIPTFFVAIVLDDFLARKDIFPIFLPFLAIVT
jgi:hypothetical protein